MRLTIGQSGFNEAVAAFLGAKEALRQEWAKDAFNVGAKGVAHATKTFRRAAETSDTATAVRTSRLWRSYAHDVKQDSNGVSLGIGILSASAQKGVLEYAGIHEFGGVIRPKNGKYLAIPLDAVKTKAGVARGTPRDFTETFVARAKGGGNLIIFQKQGKEAVPLFLLTKGPITIKARPSLQPTFDAVVLPQLERAVADTGVRVLAGRSN